MDYASTFTRHLARYTLSGHLIALQRMATESPKRKCWIPAARARSEKMPRERETWRRRAAEETGIQAERSMDQRPNSQVASQTEISPRLH